MSRLDSLARRLEAQRACLEEAVSRAHDIPGPFLELGLGHGRTFDHLCALCPERRVFVFERVISASAEGLVPGEQLIVGDFRETLPTALARIGSLAALAHCDVGAAEPAIDRSLAAWLGEALPPLLSPGAVVATDQRLVTPALAPLSTPCAIANDRYFLYEYEEM